MLRLYLELVCEMEQKVALIRSLRPLPAEPNPCMDWRTKGHACACLLARRTCQSYADAVERVCVAGLKGSKEFSIFFFYIHG